MAQLTDSQIQALRNKGLSEEKIQALAVSKGYSIPEKGFLQKAGEALTQSTRRFGQSLAGAVGSQTNLGGKNLLEEGEAISDRVRNNMMKAIQDKRARGEDTKKLVNALKNLDQEVNFYDILNANTGGFTDKTAGQVVGEAAGVATDVLAFGTFGTAAKGMKAFQAGKGVPTALKGVQQAKTAGGFLSGAKRAAKVGALTGGVFGGAQTGALAAQEGANVGETLGAGVRGAALGGITGGALGGAIGGVTGRIAGRTQRAGNKSLNYALDFVSPEATKAARIEAGKQGRVTAPGLFRSAKIMPSRRDFQLAEAVEDVISSKNSVPKNVNLIEERVSEINAGVIDFIQNNKIRPFNTRQLQARLNEGSDDLRLVFASDTTAERTYNAVVDEFMKHVGKRDAIGLLKARQTFDNVPAIKKLLDTQRVGENTRKEVVLQVRRAANEYVADLLLEGSIYQDALRKETFLLEALGNAATKNQSTIGKNKIQLLTNKYPVLKWIIGGTAAGVVGASGIGVGSTIIGSTE